MKRMFRIGDRVRTGNGLVMEVCGYDQRHQVKVTWFDLIRKEVYFRVMPETELKRAV